MIIGPRKLVAMAKKAGVRLMGESFPAIDVEVCIDRELDSKAQLTYKNNFFVIRIRYGQSEEDKLKCLYHEITHIHQIISGKLMRTNDGWIWKNKFFPLCYNYSDQPWELLASANEYLVKGKKRI